MWRTAHSGGVKSKALLGWVSNASLDYSPHKQTRNVSTFKCAILFKVVLQRLGSLYRGLVLYSRRTPCLLAVVVALYHLPGWWQTNYTQGGRPGEEPREVEVQPTLRFVVVGWEEGRTP